MPKTTIQLAAFRAAMKTLGYRVRVQHHADFSAATVLKDGAHVNRANIITPEHLETHSAFYAWRNAHSVRDGDRIVTL